jgi:hypothetical protein
VGGVYWGSIDAESYDGVEQDVCGATNRTIIHLGGVSRVDLGSVLP